MTTFAYEPGQHRSDTNAIHHMVHPSNDQSLERAADRAADLAVCDGATRGQSGSSGPPVPPPGLGVLAASHVVSGQRGEALPGGLRAEFEPVFGQDFSDVRVHADNDAAHSARAVQSHAYTIGGHIAFAHGAYAPQTGTGKRLIAHELAHVTQQRTAGRSPVLQRDFDHSVTSTDTLFALARSFGVSVAEIQAANTMGGSTTLQDGRILIIPEFHTVTSTDTLYALGRQFGVTVAALQAANGLGMSTTITEGQRLRIPHRNRGTATVIQPAPTMQQSAQRPTTPPTAPTRVGPAGPAPTQATPAPTQATPAPTQATPAATPTTMLAPAGAGHLPGQDYPTGVLTQRSYLRETDRRTIVTSSGQRVFFENGATVTLVSIHPTDPDWVQVSGPAFIATRPPTPVTDAAGPVPVTGWIQRSWTSMTLGLYRDLAVTDRSRHFAALSSGRLRRSDVHNIVLHETESASQRSTLSTYDARMGAKSHIGAQYLIGETGEITLISPVNRRVEHVHPDLPSGANATVINSRSIGIEHVGVHRHITPASRPPRAGAPRAQQRTWAAEMTRVRNDLSALPLSPPLLARLVALSDRQLFQTMKDTAWNIDVDVNAQQKRSSFLLTGRLRADFALGLGNVFAHEAVQQKTLGEGENIRDFLVAMEAYPAQVRNLRALANARPALSANASFMSVLLHEEAQLAAIVADATAAENSALSAERAGHTPGLASARETRRTAFYADFWARITQLSELLQFLNGATAATDAAELARRLAAWRG